jgi:predicted acyl esterase
MMIGVIGCAAEDSLESPPDFNISVGVESVTVLDAEPGAPLTLYDASGTPLVTLMADDLGQAHFAYVPAEHVVLDPSNFEGLSLADGSVLLPGDGYTIQIDTMSPPDSSGTFSVLAVDEVPDPFFYELQTLVGVHSSPISDDYGDPEEGYQYIQVRDGVLLGAMVRFPDPAVYGEGPYPTVIEYSGYSPSRTDRMDSGTQIANALGYATVSVNMRGTGCSGGVFDVFNRAQHADGYDIVEIVGRQDWVLNNQVGMVGLSYPGISQLYVASTNPPSLAAIVPLSTIADAWEIQWPGGIYNKGFTRQWVEEREEQSKAGGASWVDKRIDAGDSVCEENLQLSAHSVDFETFLRGLEFRPPSADDRDLNQLVELIEAPVFYGGSFQDEQTGAHFGAMMDRFYSSEALKVQISNGRHPDGFAPHSVYRWFEFLEFYVSERIPILNQLIRVFGPVEFGGSFGMDEASFEEDRFTEYGSYEDALAAYEAEPTVRVLFESGAGSDQAGAPGARFEASYDSWPAAEAEPVVWYLGPEGSLVESAPSEGGADAWRFDPEADEDNFFGPAGYELLEPLWDIDWTPFAEGDVASYITAPFTQSSVVAGPGIAELWVRSPVDDVMVQVTLTEVRPDATEVLIQSGWLRLSHRAATVGEGLRLMRSYDQYDFEPMPVNEWVPVKLAIPSVAHPIRAGSSLRMAVSSPGRDHGTWEFETPEYEDVPTFDLGYGGATVSSLTMARLPGIAIPEELPPCPSLRGQPCRAYEPVANIPVQ